MKLLVTGAAGFIGSNFVRMIADGVFNSVSSVQVLDKLTYAGVKENLVGVEAIPGYSFVQGDICDFELISDSVKGIDAVINFAAESHVDRSILGSSSFVQTNIVGVQVLLDAIKATGRDIRFLQVSTDEVYGSISEGSWTEDWPLQPNSPYSASKASGELLARSYNRTHGMDVVITRCSNNYGVSPFP
jgi:dTDP-glucose 4,6-dehydratase